MLHTSRSTAGRVRHRLVVEGLDTALSERSRPGADPVLDARGEAVLVALACANPPEGRTAWSIQLLADELVQRGVVGAMSDDTGGARSKKRLAPWLRQRWCIPELSPDAWPRRSRRGAPAPLRRWEHDNPFG